MKENLPDERVIAKDADLVGQHPFDDPEVVRALRSLRMNNPHIVNFVDPDFPRRVNDLVIIQENTHVSDPPFSIVVKSEITGLSFLQKSDEFALGGLLMGVAEQGCIKEFKNSL